MNVLPAAVCVFDASGAVRRYNRRAAELWGRSPGLDGDARSFRGALPLLGAALDEGASIQNRETVIERPDGSPITVSMSITPLRDSGGRIVGAVSCFRDVTDRKRAEEALRESELRYRILAENVPQMVWISRPDGFVDYFNRRWREYVGLAPRETLGGEWQRAIHPAELPRALRAWNAALAAGERYKAEFRLRRADGAYRWHLAEALPHRDEHGEILKWFGTCTDVDDQKRAEEELRRAKEGADEARLEAEKVNRLKDEFLATLSHELRTPLNAILGWAHLLRSTSMDRGDLDRGLWTIERNARTQARLIEDLLDVSRIIAGKVRLDVQKIDVVGVIEAALLGVRPEAQAKGIEIARALKGPPGPISADPNRLQQVVWNLLSNAIKFTPAGGKVEVSLRCLDRVIEIQVRDTGAGIEPGFLPYVFNAFRQADGSTTRRHGGLGLGLAIARHLVELHGGSIRADSEGTGRGSTFSVTLPYAPGNAAAGAPGAGTAPAPGKAAAAPPALTGLRILVVEDEADTRDLILRVLQGAGARVTAVDSAGRAIESLRSSPPDLLLSDIGMPGEDGYELIRKVRQLPPEEGGRTPAVALTAFAGVEDRRRTIVAGFHVHVPKPVDPDELTAVIANLTGVANRRPAACRDCDGA